jgi:putative oxidoreductase
MQPAPPDSPQHAFNSRFSPNTFHHVRQKIHDFFELIARPFGRESVLLLLRMWLGVMMVYHGSDKAFRSFELFSSHITTFGIPFAQFVSLFVVTSQFAGGVMIFFGFLTRPALVCVLVTVFSAVMESMFYLTYDPFSRKAELALTYSVLAFSLFIAGPGLYSVDGQLAKTHDEHE